MSEKLPLLRFACPPSEGYLLLSTYSGSQYWSLGYDEVDQVLYVRAGSVHTLNLFRDLLIRLYGDDVGGKAIHDNRDELGTT